MADSTIKLLIVDDEPATRTSLTAIFSNLGHHVRAAEDGFAALRLIRDRQPDVLLSDLNMPGMSGFELLSVVRRRFPSIPVVAMSSAYSGVEVPLGIAADAFYEKATDLRSLLTLMETAAQRESSPLRNADAFAPIRLAILPIGAYKPEWFMGPVHQSPSQAIDAQAVLHAETALAIHFGTFPLADDGQDEPVDVLHAERKNRPDQRFWGLGFGEGRDVPTIGTPVVNGE